MWARQVLVLLFEQQDRLVATIKFIYAGIYKKQKGKKGWMQAQTNKLQIVNR